MDGKVRRAIVASVGVLAILLSLAVVSKTFRHALDDTASLASWAVAAGTLVLATATFQLARRAREEAQAVRDEAKEVSDQVALQREQMANSARAYVYPSVPSEWARGERDWAGRHQEALPLKNGGPGWALNVHGRAVWWLASGVWRTLELLGSSIASGDDTIARVSAPAENGWAGANAYLKYSDLLGDDWVTYFRFRNGGGGQLVSEHLPPERITDRDPDAFDEATISSKWPG